MSAVAAGPATSAKLRRWNGSASATGCTTARGAVRG
jgi:hypothetical protein